MGGISQVNFSTNYGQFARPTASAPDLSADTPKRSSAVGNMLGTTVRESLDPKAIAKDALNCGVSNIPFDMLFSSQAYRRGDLKANEYVAHVVADSIGFSTWTVGGAVATFALGPAITAGLAFAPAWVPVVAVGAVGFAAGMLIQDLFDRAIGHKIAKKLAEVIPAKDVKPLCDWWVKNIANPLNDHFWQPVWGFIKKHKAVAIGAGAALGLKFPALGKQMLTMGAGMGLGIGANILTTKVLGPSNDPFDKGANDTGIPIKPEWIKSFNDKRQSLMSQGESAQQAEADTKKAFASILIQNKMDAKLAAALVDEIAKKADSGSSDAASQDTGSQPTAGGQALPAGMLMARTGTVSVQRQSSGQAGGQALPAGMLMGR